MAGALPAMILSAAVNDLAVLARLLAFDACCNRLWQFAENNNPRADPSALGKMHDMLVMHSETAG